MDLPLVLTTLNELESSGTREVATCMCNTFILISSNSEGLKNEYIIVFYMTSDISLCSISRLTLLFLVSYI